VRVVYGDIKLHNIALQNTPADLSYTVHVIATEIGTLDENGWPKRCEEIPASLV
jgi:hypothetical protein